MTKPVRRSTPSLTPPASPPAPMRSRRRLVAVASLILAAVALTLVLRRAPANTLPVQLHGVWRTDTPKYASRRFEIRAHILTFQVGEDQRAVTRHAIAQVSTSGTPEGTLYRVIYFEDDEESAEMSFDFVFRNEVEPEILPVNQVGVVWRRRLARE